MKNDMKITLKFKREHRVEFTKYLLLKYIATDVRVIANVNGEEVFTVLSENGNRHNALFALQLLVSKRFNEKYAKDVFNFLSRRYFNA